eukprot:CCRYP_011522-RA/>CCRYP_011522-RA protein AED:0.47 eAED:0.47 QI:36/1/1/1/0/0/2/92/53
MSPWFTHLPMDDFRLLQRGRHGHNVSDVSSVGRAGSKRKPQASQTSTELLIPI